VALDPEALAGEGAAVLLVLARDEELGVDPFQDETSPVYKSSRTFRTLWFCSLETTRA
jgi:hypothetical protein